MTRKSISLVFPLLLVFYELCTYLSNDMYFPALPSMMSDLKMTAHQAQLTLTTWFIGSASLPLILGVISDRYGRRPIVLWGGLIYILSTIACALATEIHSLLIARYIQGAMIASVLVPGYASIHEYYEQKDAVRILAIMGSITILAPTLGPLLGSIVLLVGNWQLIFWLIAIASTLAVSLLYFWMPETLPKEARHPVHLVSLFKQYWRLLTNTNFMLLICVLGFIFASFITWITAGPLLVIESFKLSAVTYGLIQVLIFSACILGNYWVKRLVDQIEIHTLIQRGLLATALSGILVVTTGYIFPYHLSFFILAFMSFSFGSALCFAPLNRVIIESSPEPMGVRVAFFTVCWTMFAVLGSLAASIFFNGT